MSDIIYFEFNNWFSGRDYPIGEPFETWVNKNKFSNEEWVKENKLCVRSGNIDMSVNWCITATREWVEKNCPVLLTNDEYSYIIILHDAQGDHDIPHVGHYSDFLREPDEDGDVYGMFDWPFLEYSEENIGVHYYSEEDEYNDYNDEDDEDAEYWNDGCPIEDCEE